MIDQLDGKAKVQRGDGIRSDAEIAVTERKAYRTPTLTELGSLVTDTKAGGGAAADSQGAGSAT